MPKNQTARVAVVLMSINAALAAVKVTVGLLDRSGALTSDGVDSAGDVLSGLIAMIGAHAAGRMSDTDHPYGHEKLESVSALALSGLLLLSGLAIGYAAVRGMLSGAAQGAAPGVAALAAAGLSMVVKQAMALSTRRVARRVKSDSLSATAWNYQADVWTSLGSFAGVLGGRLGAPWADPAASLIICALILRVAYRVGHDAIDHLVDHACDPETERAMRETVLAQHGVVALDSLQTRMFGQRIYVDIAISADGEQPLTEAHDIAERVHDAIEHQFPDVKHCMVHVNPAP
ncbi:MAG: cation transporter [Clostridiales bacterium]|nr:cation transporter [Clostridiales bacterium]